MRINKTKYIKQKEIHEKSNQFKKWYNNLSLRNKIRYKIFSSEDLLF